MVAGRFPVRVKEKNMAEEKTLSAALRTNDFGSAGSRRVVRSGRIPAVVYGKKGVAPLYVTVDAKEFNMKRHEFTETTLINLQVKDAEPHMVFVKAVQDNLLKNCIQHIDFFEITYGQMLRTHVRVALTGTPDGVRAGGVLDQVTHEIEIECFPRNLPEEIVADVTSLGLNETLRISDLKIADEIKVLSDPETAIASVRMVKEEVAAPETEETAADATATTDAAATDGDNK